MKWAEEKVKEVIAEARDAGIVSARAKMNELINSGPKYSVLDGGVRVGTMLDVCGFTHLRIPARGKFYTLAKLVCENQILRFRCCHDSYYGGGRLNIFDSTTRQELSVNEAACKGQASVLAKYGIIASVISRVD